MGEHPLRLRPLRIDRREHRSRERTLTALGAVEELDAVHEEERRSGGEPGALVPVEERPILGDVA